MKGFAKHNHSKPKKNGINKTSKLELIAKALKFHSQGNILEATKYYRYFISQGFHDHRMFSNYGVILRDLGKFKEAEIATRKAIELKPDYPLAYSNLGGILRDLGKLEDAEFANRKAIKLNPNNAEAYLNLGIVKRDLGKYKEAELATLKAIELKPNFSNAHRNLSICLYLLKDINSALKSIIKANSLNNKDILNKLLFSIFETEKIKKQKPIKTSSKFKKKSSIPNTLFFNLPVESKLINKLYKFKIRDQEIYQGPTYGDAKGSNYKLFEKHDKDIQSIKDKLITIAKDSVESEIFVSESFFTIFRSGGGLKSHDHLGSIDKIIGLNIASKKFSLVYYIDVGDQNCEDPGILKLENPNQDILPSNGLVIIFPAKRKHSVFYKGQKDRIIIGINFYKLS